MDIVKVLIEFIITFLIVYLFYYLFVIRKCKKDKRVIPAEVALILSIYQIDYNKINLYQMIKIVSLVTTIILSVIVTIISKYFNSTIILLVFGTLISVLVAIICYRFIGNYYKNKSNTIKKD